MNLTTRTGLAGIILLLFASIVYASGHQDIRITTDYSNQRHPAIYEDIIVWQDNRNKNWDIYGYNLETCEEFQITYNLHPQVRPAVYGSIVVWEDYRHDRRDIYGYDLETHSEFRITTTGKNSSPAIYEDVVVWVDSTLGYSGVRGIILSTHQEFQVTPDPDRQYDPAVYNEYVVWEDRRKSDSFIYGYNILTGEEFQISGKPHLLSFGEDHCHPAVYNETVIWADRYDIIYGYNLAHGKEFIIADARWDECSFDQRADIDDSTPAIYGDLVIWVDCRNGSPDIYGFNISTFEEVQIIVHKARQREPALYGRSVVWSDDRNGNWDIYCRFIDSLVPAESSRTEHVRRNFLYLSGLGFFVVATAFFIGRTTWHTAKRGGFSEAPSGVRDFRREGPSPWLVGYAFFLPLYTLFYMEFMNSYYMVVVSFVFSVNILFAVIWGRKTPYIRITPDNIIIFPYTIRKPTIIEIVRIREVNFHVKDKVQLLLSDGKTVNINLIFMDVNDEVMFIDALKEVTKS